MSLSGRPKIHLAIFAKPTDICQNKPRDTTKYKQMQSSKHMEKKCNSVKMCQIHSYNMQLGISMQ